MAGSLNLRLLKIEKIDLNRCSRCTMLLLGFLVTSELFSAEVVTSCLDGDSVVWRGSVELVRDGGLCSP